MSAIARTIWMIETHYGEPVSLDEMAANAGVSRSHLSRIFPLATGWSISAYLRGRRLTEAAKVLAAGAPDILGVALDAGYGSHEAFTRAFRDQFGQTPDEVRRARSLDRLSLVEPLPMDTPDAVKLDPPRLETRAPMRIAGLLERHEMSRTNTIPAQWQRFQQYLEHIPGAVPGTAYGVVADADETTCDYMSGQQITGTPELPPGFKVLNIPGRRYARFAHRGHISTIQQTIRAIFDHGLPDNHLTQAEGVSFLEVYGPGFNPQTGLGDTEIWIGLSD